MFLKILYLVIVCMFAGAFIFNFILNLVRDINAKKKLKNNPKECLGRIREVQQAKNRIYVDVEFKSPHNNLLLSETFELYESDINKEDYTVGKSVTILYNDIAPELKRVRNFPLQIEGLKVKLDKSSLFLNTALVALGLFVLGNTLFQFITAHAFTTDIALVDAENGIFQNYFYILIMIVIYFVLSSYLVSSIMEAPKQDINNYLKFYGNVVKARVVTFKFGKSKNSKGVKESQLEIEYSTNTGEQVKAKLSSYMYTETQEEYIDILYDPKDPRTVVYIKL